MNSGLKTYLRTNADGSKYLQAVGNLYYQIAADGVTCTVQDIANPTLEDLPFSFVQIDAEAKNIGDNSTSPGGTEGCAEYFHDRPGSSGVISTPEELMHW
jgi:hypothetical protein